MKSIKARLTITLPSDLLQQVDDLVDKKVIRNRSHAVEHVLRQSLSRKVRTAVVLAGGKDTRTYAPMKEIGQQPVLFHTLEHLRAHGITKVIFCAGSHTAELQQAVARNPVLGLEFQFVTTEEKPRGTAGALLLAAPYIGQGPFLVVHGDILTTLDISDFISFHIEQKTLATIAVKPRMSEEKYGQAFLQGNKIIQFLKTGRSEGISIVNTGVYILQPEVLDYIPKDTVSQIEQDIFPQLAHRRELSAFIFQGIWYDISAADTYQEAAAQWLRERI